MAHVDDMATHAIGRYLPFTQTGIQAVLAIPLGMSYIVVPLLDWLVGTDTNNPLRS